MAVILLVTVLILQSASVSLPVAGKYYVEGWQWTTSFITASCRSGTFISVTSARYAANNWLCWPYSGATSVVRSKCNNKSYCYVSTKPYVTFPANPCPLFKKKASVRYDCKSCPSGQRFTGSRCAYVAVDGVWDYWTVTSACTVTCGGGKIRYSRKCREPKHGGKACGGDASKTEICGEVKCPVDGVWDKWTETSACTVTCGGGKITYSRKCIDPQHGGKACEGDASKTEICGEENCPVDGVWEEWTETSACTVTCGGGKITHSRKCREPQHGGKACEGDASKTEICGEENCPVDGVWEEWTETSACTVTCGGGKIRYSRKCREPQHGGKACEGDASKTEICGEEICPDELTITTVENSVDCIEKSKTSCTIKWKIDSTHGDKIGNKQVKICEFSNGKTSSCKTSTFKKDAYERKFGKTRKISHSGKYVAVVSIDGVETISDAVTLNITANTTKKGKKEKKNKN